MGCLGTCEGVRADSEVQKNCPAIVTMAKPQTLGWHHNLSSWVPARKKRCLWEKPGSWQYEDY